jgi:hypothetical protein
LTKFFICTVILLSAFLFRPVVSSAQTHLTHVKADFILKVLPDNSWTLQLKKNKTYQYTHWSGFSDKQGIIDKGTYTIDGDKLILKSTHAEKALDGKTYYIKKYKLKGKWQVNTKRQIFEYKRNSLRGHTIVLLSEEPITQDDTEVVNYKYPPDF